MSRKSVILCAIICVGIVTFYEFAIGVYDAVFLYRYSNRIFSLECQQIWGWVCVSFVINICGSVLMCCGMTRFSNNECDNMNNILILQVLQISQLAIAIWYIGTYYIINKFCHDYWTIHNHEFCIFVIIYFMMLWISVSIIGIITVLSCSGWCAKICCCGDRSRIAEISAE
jgi:hypothetical protein